MKSTHRLKRSLQTHTRAQSLTEAVKSSKGLPTSPQTSPTTNQSYNHVAKVGGSKPQPQQSLVDFWFAKYVQEFYSTPKAKSTIADPGQLALAKPRVVRRLKPQSFAAADTPSAEPAARQFALQLKVMRLFQCLEVLSRKAYRSSFDRFLKWKRRLRRSRKKTRSNVPQHVEPAAPVQYKHRTPRQKRSGLADTLQTPKKKRLHRKKKGKRLPVIPRSKMQTTVECLTTEQNRPVFIFTYKHGLSALKSALARYQTKHAFAQMKRTRSNPVQGMKKLANLFWKRKTLFWLALKKYVVCGDEDAQLYALLLKKELRAPRPVASLLGRLHQILTLKHSQTRFVVLQIIKRCWMKQQFARLKLKQLSEVIRECSLYKESIRHAFHSIQHTLAVQHIARSE